MRLKLLAASYSCKQEKGGLPAALFGMPGWSPDMLLLMTCQFALATPRRAAASIALHARAIPHQREVAALAAHLALVALGLGFRAALGLAGSCHLSGAGLAPLEGFELLRGGQVVLDFLLQRDRAFQDIAGAA
jgi:hypothetical protein